MKYEPNNIKHQTLCCLKSEARLSFGVLMQNEVSVGGREAITLAFPCVH